MSDDFAQLARLFATIEARRAADPEESYVARLLSRGSAKAAQKVGEEAVETAIAAAQDDRHETISESADLLFHLMVLWALMDIRPAQVMAELARREGVSGLTEKARRDMGVSGRSPDDGAPR